MKTEIRRNLSMAVRVLDFAQANPSTDASFVAVVAKVKDDVARADTLDMQVRGGIAGERAALAHRRSLRRAVRDQLHHLIRVAQLTAKTDPELAAQFVYPKPPGPAKTFVNAARTMLALAVPQQDLFISLGLGSAFIDVFTQTLSAYDTSTTVAHTGRMDHVGAIAELAAVCDDCVRQTQVLGGLVRAQYQDNPALLAAWESASNVMGPFITKEVEPPPVPAPSPAPEVSGKKAAGADTVQTA